MFERVAKLVKTDRIGLRGLVGQLYREDNAHKIRRGQAGRVGKGLNAGGLTAKPLFPVTQASV
jgi:hypothetical protein